MDVLLNSISSHALTEWMAYHGIEPFGDELIDIHMAQIASILINSNRKKGSSPIDPEKLRMWKVTKKAFNVQEFYNDLKAWAEFKQD